MRRTVVTLLAVLALTASSAAPAIANQLPEIIDLPNGFFPEGIAIGRGHAFYTGSLIDGAIYRGDLRTGDGEILVPGVAGNLAVGMAFERRTGHLFVAGGPSGSIRIYDTATGDLVDEMLLGDGFINDVVITETAAYITNSFAPELYSVPLSGDGQVVGPPSTIHLTGDFDFVPGAFNANGIEASQDRLIVVNSTVGALYVVDPVSGVAHQIDLGGAVVNGDGLVLVGRTLYAVVGSTNEVAKIRLAPNLGSGVVTGSITSDAFDVPTTAARFGNSLYVVNAKFGTPPTPDTPYEIVRVRG